MRFNTFKSHLIKSGLAASVLLLASGAAFAQQQINLIAAPANANLPDGSSVPMWGYGCGAIVSGSLATCAATNPAVVTTAATTTTPAVMSGWSPVVITIPTGATGGLTINLTNSLPGAVAETSLVIVGQLGGGLGDATQRTTTASPAHGTQDTTWPIAAAGAQNTPPPQGNRVQSFSTPVGPGATKSLNWATLQPGTYLIESGTHPSIQGPMGLYGILVVTTAPAGATAGTAYGTAGTATAVSYNAEIPVLLSEIDPVQNGTVATAVGTGGFVETNVWAGFTGPSNTTVLCRTVTGGAAPNGACYPPAVNYTPLYYVVNGVAFNSKSSAASAGASLFAPLPSTATAPIAGSVLVRFVNAGLRMHVPSIVGSQTTPPVITTGTVAAAVPGFSLIAEDGNPLPGVSRVQSEVFMAAGKTYDVMINVPAAGGTALPVFDRQLSLSANSIGRDAGMLAYLSVNGAGLPAAAAAAFAAVHANPDTYNSVISGNTLTVSDPGKGVLGNDINVTGAHVVGPTPAGLTLNPDGTFVYTAGTPTTFTYCGNGATAGAACALVTLAAAPVEAAAGITCPASAFSATVSTTVSIKPPGVLAGCKDTAGYPLTVNLASVAAGALLTVTVDPNGGFNASEAACVPVAPATTCTRTFTFKAQNSQNTVSTSTATVTLTFPASSGVAVKLMDGSTKKLLTGGAFNTGDFRWIIEEDRTFYINPNCTTNPPPAGCPTSASGIVPTFGTNFHTSYMPVVAAGCTGPLSCESGQTVLGQAAVCDVGNGVCRTTATQQAPLNPTTVHLDPTKRYYISVLPGDAANSFENLNSCLSDATPDCGHGMGGAPIACVPAAGSVACTATTGAFPATVNVVVQPNPFPPSKLSVFVFEDDFPLNGEQDAGGGVDVVSPNEPGLGGFNITLFDDAGGTGDATGQMTYDMFNMPLSNGLAGTIDPVTNQDACPISGANQNVGFDGTTASPTGITGTIVTCPKYEADGKTISPLAGQAVISNLMPGRYGVVATPGADRIARGEEWLQTNTLDGQKAHDSFLRIGEPSFFQEYGPAGFHVSIGFANPAIINGRKADVCNGTDPNAPSPGTKLNCNNSIKGTVTTERMSRTPDERLYGSGDNSSFSFTQCYVSFGDPDGEDFAFTKCDSNGQFTLSGLPDGDWRVTVFDQWNDMLVDGLSTPVRLAGGATINMGEIATNQWQANLYTSSFLDLNGNGVRDGNELGLALVATNIRFRDGSYSNFNNTDLFGNAGFNEVFPLFSWYVVEDDSTRYKSTGTHVVYDAGGPADGSPPCGTTGYPPCGTSGIGNMLANTAEQIPVPANLRVPGAFYCGTADCTDAPSPLAAGGAGGSTGRVDPPWWFGTEGWQGFSGQNSFIEFGKKPFVGGETGGIHGEVIYASTRPFDDPTLLIHTSWTPDVPNVTVNLYQESTAPDGSVALTLIDTTKTSSWDDWAQGFRTDGMPNMNCPGQGAASGTNPDLFFFSLYNQPNWLDQYNNGGTAAHTLPNNSQFKCYDGMHNWNQLQPAPYDGMYMFPSITSINPSTGQPAGTNCTACVYNPDASDPYRFGHNNAGTWTPGTGHGAPMLPPGKYVVEVVVPPGYELVKEEDKNILIGDNYIAPPTQEFAGLGAVFILPDQAEVAARYNQNNAQNPTNTFGRTTLPNHEGDTGSVEQFWPCVGASRIVPDFISLFPQSMEVAPFAGATRNLCDRKEVTLTEQTAALAKFWIFSSTHVAAHFTGVITDDYTSEFDPFSPQFGEKFAPPDLPVSLKDWTGTEISRVYADHWGAYNGLTYSTWEVNPPNPTGYAPTMMVTCMNDPGTGPAPDPLFNPQYSQFCYEIPFMPGQTQYMDTPVVPTSAFAGAGYNNPDCAYPPATPAVAEVDGDQTGPWVSAAGKTLTITALGDQVVPNYAYSGPAATTAPFNQKTVTRHYGFGAQCTALGGACTQISSVTIGGVTAPVTGWSDTSITVTVPPGVPNCAVQQQAQYGGPNGTTVSTAQCGELMITAGNGKQSIDAVTVTIGGKAPSHVLASGSVQSAIDAAAPGDLIIIDPTCSTAATPGVACSTAGVNRKTNATHTELLVMWKPVRLQGVGAASSIINANTHPAGKMDSWRQRINCLFGLTLQGRLIDSTHPYDPSGSVKCPAAGWNYFVETKNGSGTLLNAQVDSLPLEAIIGWDATQNGNLAELLQEPTLMGALEGAGITILAKGVRFFSPLTVNVGLAGELGGFPPGTTLLTGPVSVTGTYSTGDANSRCHTSNSNATNPFPSNFSCNPSGIDGLTITNSSQGGGGVFVHGWGHNLQIANNRIYGNAGTLSGGINLGQGEFAPSYIAGSATNAPPGSCVTSGVVTNAQQPYCNNLNVSIHNNDISSNSSTGDELFSGTPAGAGGVSICTGADYYKFNYNWVCGNLSSSDGGGIAHMGFSYNGDIEHNSILFNQSLNPTIPANGGGLLVMGTPDADPTCGATVDTDCVPTPGSVSPSDGTGPNLVINANLIMGNAAEAGSGGGLRLQNVNGSEVLAFPRTPTRWYSPQVTNNIIADNVAGWDGGGISLVDALNVNIINNTVVSNSTTASAGILFTTIGAPVASSEGSNCVNGTETSCPQVAGLVSIQNSTLLTSNLPATITCPAYHSLTSGGSLATVTVNNGTCRKFSYPLLENNIFWQNSAYYIGVGTPISPQYQQNIVSLYNAFTATLAPSQPQAGPPVAHGAGVTIGGGTGACVAASYWDIGVRGDTGPALVNRISGISLAPLYSVLTNTAGYTTRGLTVLNNSQNNPNFASQYCDGSRQPPEFGSSGWQVPPGIADATVPNPAFNLQPVATVDEGNNWINMRWGPLSLLNPVTNAVLGNYALTAAIDTVPTSEPNFALVPRLDFFGNTRPEQVPPGDASFDPGAVEYGSSPPVAVLSVTGGPLAFGNAGVGFPSTARTLTLHNTGLAAGTGIALTFSSPLFSRPAGAAGGTCTTVLNANSTCTINVVFTPTALGAAAGTLTIAANVAVAGSPVGLGGTGVTPVITATLTPVTWTPSATRGCTTGIAGIGGTCPTQIFALTNTGNVTLTGITRGALGGANASEFTVTRLLSTCGPAGGGQALGVTTLAPGAACIVTLRFSPVTGQSTGTQNATISVTDVAGTQTSTLTGTAN